MFPHLKELNLCGEEKGTIISDFPLFVSPNLKSVSVEVRSHADDAPNSAHLMGYFLSIMQEKDVPLEHLEVAANIPITVISFFSTLPRSSTLRFLRLEGVRVLDADETDWVTDLGLIEALEDLKLVVEEDTRTTREPIITIRAPSAARALGNIYDPLDV
jgi:hypothetical protein